MKNNEDITQLIDRYLSGDLNAAELRTFKQQLATDTNLAKELELERVLQKAIFDNGLLDWKQAIQAETASLKKQKRVKKIVSAAVVGLVAIALVTWFATKQTPKVIPSPVIEIEQLEVVKTKEATAPKVVEEKPVETVSPVPSKTIVVMDTVKKTASPLVLKGQPVAIKPVETPKVEAQKTIEKPLVVAPADPCVNVVISADLQSTATCEGKQEGSIEVKNVKGGNGKYMYKLTTTSWQQATIFNQLPAGNYRVEAKDGNGCISVINNTVEVNEKVCYTPEAGFNPDFETWEYPIETTEVAKMSIYNKVGQLVYQAEVNDIFVWDGRDAKGQKVPLGLYKYLLESATTKKAGTVTVIY